MYICMHVCYAVTNTQNTYKYNECIYMRTHTYIYIIPTHHAIILSILRALSE